jgi:hypothetical protein
MCGLTLSESIVLIGIGECNYRQNRNLLKAGSCGKSSVGKCGGMSAGSRIPWGGRIDGSNLREGLLSSVVLTAIRQAMPMATSRQFFADHAIDRRPTRRLFFPAMALFAIRHRAVGVYTGILRA